MANPALAAIVRMKTFEFTGPDGIVYDLSSHNLAFLNSYPGAIGVKTGFTDLAGVCVIEEAQRGGRAMMAVVMDGSAPDETAGLLLDRGFRTPVSAEAATEPVLPAVVEPKPPPPPGPKRLAGPADAPASAAGTTTSGPPARLTATGGPSVISDYGWEAGAALLAIAVAGFAVGQARRRSRRK
jgi:D-alanyl-D-alanine carboxypeptidase (penicillin-binding protein 5/6)